MGYPTKVQLINRKKSQQWYVNFPAQIAQALDFSRGETVEWTVEDRETLVVRRLKAPPSALKKKLPTASSPTSKRSLKAGGRRSSSKEPGGGPAPS